MDVLFKQVRGYSGTDVWTDSLSSALRRHGVASRVSYFPSYVGYVPYLAKFIDKSKDSGSIVQGNTWNAFVFKDSNPMVVTEHLVVHDPNLEPYKTPAQKVFHKLIYQYESKSLKVADCVVCVSEYTKDMLEKAFEYSDARVIYNGVDVETFRPQTIDREKFCDYFDLPRNRTVLLFAGNPSKRKGADLLPKIMNQLDDSFILLTTSGLRDQGINDDKVRSVGRLPLQDLINLYNLSDIFVFPTRLEGMSLTVAEAMACGKPIITTDCASLPEMIINEKGGFLCQKDNFIDFADKIQYLSENEEIRKRMGSYNRIRAKESFSINDMAKQYINIYKSLS